MCLAVAKSTEYECSPAASVRRGRGVHQGKPMRSIRSYLAAKARWSFNRPASSHACVMGISLRPETRTTTRPVSNSCELMEFSHIGPKCRKAGAFTLPPPLPTAAPSVDPGTAAPVPQCALGPVQPGSADSDRTNIGPRRCRDVARTLMTDWRLFAACFSRLLQSKVSLPVRREKVPPTAQICSQLAGLATEMKSGRTVFAGWSSSDSSRAS